MENTSLSYNMPAKNKWIPKRCNGFPLLAEPILYAILSQLTELDLMALLLVDKWFNKSVNRFIEKTLSKSKIENTLQFRFLVSASKYISLKRREKDWPKILDFGDSSLPDKTLELMAKLYFGYKPHVEDFMECCREDGEDYEARLIIDVNWYSFYSSDYCFDIWDDGLAEACRYRNVSVCLYIINRMIHEERYTDAKYFSYGRCKNCNNRKIEHRVLFSTQDS